MNCLAAKVSSNRQAERQRADLWENVAAACKLKLPGVPLRNLEKRPFVLVAGGPSLRETWPQIAEMKNPFILAVNDAAAFLHDNGVRFDACAMSEVMPKPARLYDCIEPKAGYYIASQSHPTTFDKLREAGAKVHIWHLDQPGVRDLVAASGAQGPIVPGGTSCACRMANLAVQGWKARQVHMFGMDSSIADQSHAYENRWYETYQVEVAGRAFRVNTFLFKQAMTFIEQIKGWPKHVAITLHGDGLLPHALQALSQRS